MCVCFSASCFSLQWHFPDSFSHQNTSFVSFGLRCCIYKGKWREWGSIFCRGVAQIKQRFYFILFSIIIIIIEIYLLLIKIISNNYLSAENNIINHAQLISRKWNNEMAKRCWELNFSNAHGYWVVALLMELKLLPFDYEYK